MSELRTSTPDMVCHIMLLVALNFETLPFQAAEEEAPAKYGLFLFCTSD